MDFEAKLAEIRTLVETSRSMPMSSSAVVNRAELLELLDQLHQAMGEAFVESTRVVASGNTVVEDAHKQAELIVRDAQIERDRLTSDTEVFRLAQRTADTMRADAKTESEALRAETDEYVDAKLANFEITLERTLEAVKRGRQRLTGGGVFGTLTPEEADKIVLPEHLI